MTKWQYKTVDITTKWGFTGNHPDQAELDRQLQALGQDGWELVGAVPNPSLSKAPTILVFKRPEGE